MIIGTINIIGNNIPAALNSEYITLLNVPPLYDMWALRILNCVISAPQMIATIVCPNSCATRYSKPPARRIHGNKIANFIFSFTHLPSLHISFHSNFQPFIIRQTPVCPHNVIRLTSILPYISAPKETYLSLDGKLCLFWCARRDLNLRPPASETVTLSTELRAHAENTSLLY